MCFHDVNSNRLIVKTINVPSFYNSNEYRNALAPIIIVLDVVGNPVTSKIPVTDQNVRATGSR